MSASVTARFVVERPEFALHVDIDVPAPGITGIFGKSGSGKTTLLRCIAGLESPASGRLAIGEDVWHDTVDGVDRAVHRRAVGYVFQEPRLFANRDVEGNLSYGMQRAGSRRRSVDKEYIVDLLELRSLLRRRPDELSGGEAQRVAIGRALLSAPVLLLMDEPLSSLDEEHKEEILPFLERLHSELAIPVIYVSHSIDEISRLCDQLIVIEGGRAVATGPLQDVLTGMQLPILCGREAGSVIDARISGLDPGYQLTTVMFSGGELVLPGVLGAPGAEVRARIRASDVSLCRDKPVNTTILNVLPARIDSIDDDGDGATVLVRLALGEDRLLARITRRSARSLDLRDGEDVYAQIKSATVRF